jgi:transposase
VSVTTAIFGTFRDDLERLYELLRKHKVRRLVMESTGVYWMPVWNVLERAGWKFELVLVNPQHLKALPGRKTDEQDCKRLAELGQYDLLRGSLIPPRPIRELRDLTRRRTHMMRDRNRTVNRIAGLLETANYKLGSVVSAGKRHSGRTRKGNCYLRRLLLQNAWAVAHMKDCFLTSVFLRVAARRG